MTIEQIIELLLNHGSLGIFAGYLIFESHRLRKQQAETVTGFTTSIDQLRSDRNDSEAKLRTRYDGVIDQLQMEKSQAKTILTDKVRALESKTDMILVQLESINSTISELKLREIARQER